MAFKTPSVFRTEINISDSALCSRSRFAREGDGSLVPRGLGAGCSSRIWKSGD